MKSYSRRQGDQWMEWRVYKTRPDEVNRILRNTAID